MARVDRNHVFFGVLAAALAAATWFRVHMVNQLDDQGFFDKYAFFARQILDGAWPVHRLGDLSPAYLWSMAGLLGPCNMDYFAVRTAQIAAVSLVALICAVTARRLWGGTAAIIAALTVMLSRATLLNATDLEPETLILLLNTAALAVLLATWNRWTMPIGGLLLGLSATGRPTALLPAALIGLALWWRRMEFFHPRLLVRTFPAGFAVAVLAPVVALKILYATIPGASTLMNPGTVFFEGLNPLTTGYAGDAPAVVKGVETSFAEPDALHEAYRLVADRALDTSDVRLSNRYWGQRSREFVAADPVAAATLIGRKLWLAAASHDAWDLRTTVRKQREMGSPLWMPFGVLAALGLLGLWLDRGSPQSPLLARYIGAYTLVMLVFYVTARQRNPLVPALALLAGAAVHHLVRLWRDGARSRAAAAVGAAAVLAVALCIDTRFAAEDEHTWGGPGPAQRLNPLRMMPETRGEVDTARRFDEALMLIDRGEWQRAERLLGVLEDSGYRPSRGALTTSSVAYHRARCLFRLDRHDRAILRLNQALDDAPWDPFVLALLDTAGRGDTATLGRLWDPFTADLARARALADVGDTTASRALLEHLVTTIPEWPQPAVELNRLPRPPPPAVLEDPA